MGWGGCVWGGGGGSPLVRVRAGRQLRALVRQPQVSARQVCLVKQPTPPAARAPACGSPCARAPPPRPYMGGRRGHLHSCGPARGVQSRPPPTPLCRLLDVLWDQRKLYLVLEAMPRDLQAHLAQEPSARSLPSAKVGTCSGREGSRHASGTCEGRLHVPLLRGGSRQRSSPLSRCTRCAMAPRT